jgi:cytoplasmic iron level regulating protein YaaA (DUF328/UPF0246 family)
MKLVLSPTKTMVFKPNYPGLDTSIPEFEDQARQIIDSLRPLTVVQLKSLYKTSDALIQKTHEQIHGFSTARTGPALFVYQGEAFKTLSADDFSKTQVAFAQEHLRIFSGLYGILNPLDEIRPHRLDFGTPHRFKGKRLKQFWKPHVCKHVARFLTSDTLLINLASDEYSSILNTPEFKTKILHIQFRQMKDGQLKNLPIRAKQARGIFARAIITQDIAQPEHLKDIFVDGYQFSKRLSSDWEWFFVRKE